MKPLLFISICLLAHSSLYAADTQTVAPEPLSIDQAARIAWERSRDVLIAQSQLISAAAQGRSGTAFLRPQLEVSASYIREDEGEPTLGQSTLEDIYQSKIAVDQFLYGFGKRRAANNAATYLNLAASANFKHMRNEASTLTRRAYTEIWLSQENASINTLRVKQRLDEVNDSKALAAAGSISALDLRLAEINYASALNSMSQAKGDVQLAMLHLARLLSMNGSGETAPFIIVGNVHQACAIDPLLKRAKQLLLESSDLASLRAQQELQQANQALIDSNRYPQISAQANYSGIGEEFDDSEYQWQIGVGLKWTIYDGGSRVADSEQYAAQAQSLEQQFFKLSEAKLQILQASIINARTLQSSIEQQTQIIELADKNYKDTRLLYKSGGTTITRLGDSSLALEEARFLLARYKYQLHNLAITLQQLTEQEPATDNTNKSSNKSTEADDIND